MVELLIPNPMLYGSCTNSVHRPIDSEGSMPTPYHLNPLYQTLGINIQGISIVLLKMIVGETRLENIVNNNPKNNEGKGWYAANRGTPRLDWCHQKLNSPFAKRLAM